MNLNKLMNFNIISLITVIFTVNTYAFERPNVILIMTDDQGYGDLGYNGNKAINTPNLDKLSTKSLHLDNFHVDPTCAPTRAALMTDVILLVVVSGIQCKVVICLEAVK